MKKVFDLLLPEKIDNHLHGSQIPLYVFTIYAGISTVRSCIHLLAPDGGAGSIAGMDLNVAGASGIVFAFALWGSAQLLLAFLQLLVVIRYRALVPLMYLLLAVEILLRMLVGATKPVTFAHTPPGAIGNYILLPLALLMLTWSLWSGIRDQF
jgi:hypothetical protein